MKNTLLILLELLICAMPVMANAQVGEKEDVTVSGVVTSAEDGAPLIGVVVMSSAGGVSVPLTMEVIQFPYRPEHSLHFMQSVIRR